MLFLLSIAGASVALTKTDGSKLTAEGDYVIPRAEISKYKSWLKVTPRPHPVKFTLDGIDGINS